jgi:hypothetical protein
MPPENHVAASRSQTAAPRHALCVVALAVALGGAPITALAAVYQPIATTGHDADIVYEAGLAFGQVGANSELGGRQFYEDGVSTQTMAHKPGLPQMVSGVSAAGGNSLNFSFEPFELNNVLKFGAGVGAKTLTLEAPAAYSNLAVVLSAGNLNADAGSGPLETAIIPYTISYAGGPTQTGILRSADWSIRGTPASNRTEKLLSVGRIGASPPPVWPQTPEADIQADRWNVFFNQIALDGTESDLLSVTFGPVTLDDADGQLNADDDVVIFGLAGVPRAVPTMTLEVDPSNGLVRFRNDASAPISLTGYEITSAAGSINLAGWNSLADQNLNPVDGPDAGVELGNSPGESWAEAAGSSAFAMQEGFLLGSTTVDAGGSLSIGSAYSAAIDARDLVANLRKNDSTIVPLEVEYLDVAIPGDFNGDQDVDGDDLDIWKLDYGSMSADPLSGDADGDADADGQDFLMWQHNVSTSAVNAASISIPEPGAWAILVTTLLPLVGRRRPFGCRAATDDQLSRSLYFLR